MMDSDATDKGAENFRDTAAHPGCPKDPNGLMVLTFRMCGERFALHVQHVNEVLDQMPQTFVPKAPPWAPSLINVRGSVVPVFDIHYRLGLPDSQAALDTRFVVLDVMIWNEITRLAVRVDAVEDVIEADRSSFEMIPELGARWPAEFIEGVAHYNDDLVILLNSETLFTVDRRLAEAARA